jgi:deazaflavin-dependent oxidoreductase (nitroreductase family)
VPGMEIRSRMRRGWLTLIKHSLNRLTAAIARTSFGPFSIVRHTGRRSGRIYETPIIVQPTDGGFVIALTYGPDVDWYRNVLAANSCDILRHRQWYHVTAVEPIDFERGVRAFSPAQQAILRRDRALVFGRLVVHGAGRLKRPRAG